MLTLSTPRNYRAQCQTLAFLFAANAALGIPLASPDDDTQVNQEWADAAHTHLSDKNATTAMHHAIDAWIEEENEAGRLTGSSPRIPLPTPVAPARYRYAVDAHGNVDSQPAAAGVYAISGGALLIRGRTRD